MRRPSAEAGPATSTGCPVCPGEPLELVQPSERRPRLVLGICEACGGLWLMREARAEEGPPGWRVAGRAGLLGRGA